MTRYLFSYFTSAQDADGEQVRFARNTGEDALHWEPLNGGNPVLRWEDGRGGVRDPFLLRAAGLPGERAAFYLLATDMRVHGRDTPGFWDHEQRHGSRGIVVWESADLLTWTAPRLVTVAPEHAGNAWAPEAVYDPEHGHYLVFWASRLYRLGDAERGESYNRMLAATTVDLRTFSAPFVWSDPGHSVIDATVVHHDGWWWRFVKDERTPGSDTPAARFITLERSRDLYAPRWELVRESIGAGTDNEPGVVRGEGPIIVPPALGRPWVLLVDEFGLRRYTAFTADGLDGEWRLESRCRLPAGASHGSVLGITEDEWRRLAVHCELPAG